jgi:isochorismate pyruvate lyase
MAAAQPSTDSGDLARQVEPNPQGKPLRRFKDPAYVPLTASLAEVRANIDRLDQAILPLLAERTRYVQDAARFKADSFQVGAPARVEAVINNIRNMAAQHGMPESVAEAAYRALITASIAHEQQHFDDMETL